MNTLRIATRGSQLAVAQSSQIAAMLEQALGVTTELVQFTTRGDTATGPLQAVGGKGLFTAELEAALRAGTVDLAVHSAKDMPAEMEADMVIAAVPPRADPRDALVTRLGSLASLPAGATVGTGSPRRAAMLRALRSDLSIQPLRGNVDTRLGKALTQDSSGQSALGGVVLAMAGLIRSGLWQAHRDEIFPLAVESMIPSPGQGTLVLQTHASRVEVLSALATVNDEASSQALLAERAVVRALQADCHSCLAVHVLPADTGKHWLGLAMVAREEGTDAIHLTVAQPSAEAVGQMLAKELLARGARAILGSDRT